MHFDAVYPERSRGAQCKQKGFAPILILVGIAVLMTAVAAGAYYFGKSQTPVVVSSTPQPTINSSTSSGETQVSSSRISETQAIEIAKKAAQVTTVKRIRAIIVDNAKYGNIWEVDLFLNESSTGISGKTVLIDVEKGNIIEISDLSILP